MKITIRKPIGYTHIGRKDRQEDAVWPPFDAATPDSRCIVLCDGVGGSAHGEIASRTVANTIGEYFTLILPTKDVVDESDVASAVDKAYDELDKVDTNDSANGQPSMATTMTCTCIHDEGILAAHMGDSRIYLVRPGHGLLYQSSDHSLVNALLMAGELTPEEAKTFPRKNVITKALQPNAGKRMKAEVHQLTDIKGGDYVFMCCDGVLEQLTNERLVEILSMDCSDDEKLALLQAESTDRTRDNYTAYLIPIDKVEGESTLANNDDEVATVMVEKPESGSPTADAPATTATPKNAATKIGRNKIILTAIAFIAVASVIFFIGRSSAGWSGKEAETPKVDTPTKPADGNDNAKSIEKKASELQEVAKKINEAAENSGGTNETPSDQPIVNSPSATSPADPPIVP